MTTSVPRMPSSGSPVPALLGRLLTDPGQPRLTWYGVGGERVELSGHVLDNWVTKTTNLLVEEMDCGPDEQVLVDLPAHWRTVVWALAAWRTGACVVLTGADDEPADDERVASGRAGGASVIVTTRPGAWTGTSADVVAVELGALARAFAGDLPAGATDAASAVMTYGDVLGYAPEARADAPALVLTGGTITHGDLAEWARETVAAVDTPWAAAVLAGPQQRALVEVGDVPVLLAATLTVLAGGGSLVLVDPSSDADRGRVAETERVTAGPTTP